MIVERSTIGGAVRGVDRAETAPNHANALTGGATSMAARNSTPCQECQSVPSGLANLNPPLCPPCYQREWAKRNRHKAAEYQRRFHARLGREEVLARGAAYRAANRDRVNACAREYRSNNKNRRRQSRIIQAAKDRARQRDLPCDLGAITFPEACPICGVRFSEIPKLGRRGGAVSSSPSIDRLIPSLGYTDENCWVICRDCNRRKSDSTPDFMRAILAEVGRRGLERSAPKAGAVPE